ncbi:transposase [Hymenobacter sp. B81]|uniref:transposase n=1 Tax=Hymenobacter sp. B81 TaxID=3344878 RepID=UPI0037DD0E61
MSHVFKSLWVHVTWATKNRHPWISPSLKMPLYDFMRGTARGNDIHLDFINGVADHVHCLLSLKTTDRLDQIVHQLKGSSAHWVNELGLVGVDTFGWQTGYGAFSVSPTHVERVRNYIRNQEAHHRQQDYWREMEVLATLAGQ